MSVVEITPTGDVVTDAPTPGFQEPIGRSASSALSSKTGRKIVYLSGLPVDDPDLRSVRLVVP